MKHLPLLFILFIFAGCQSESSTVSDQQDQGSMPEEAQASTDPFASYLAASMPEWRLVDESEWLMEDYVQTYNANENIKEKISYESEVLQEVDLNGDGQMDYAAFLIDTSNNAVLWAFHRSGDGFEGFQVSQEGTIQGCCLGSGIARKAPGMVSGIELKSDGIRYKIYEKSEMLYYFDGSAYQSTFLSD